MKPYILQYKEAIERGWIEINGEQRKLVVGWKIKRVIDILASYFNDERFIFDPTNCYKRFDFMESLALQSEAPYYGQPIKLMLFQKAFFEAIYSFYDKATGLLLINEALLEMGRKNGKSTMIAADCFADLFLAKGCNFCCSSNDDKQAKLIWEAVGKFRSQLDPKNEITRQNLTDIKNTKNNVKVQRLSSGTKAKDGYNFVKAYIDEAHDMKDNTIEQALKRSMSTHDERLLVTISTNGFINDGYFDKALAYANAWLKGEIDNVHYIPFLYEQDDEAEIWGDPDNWQKANPSLIYGVKKKAFIEESITKAQIDRAERIHMLTKDFNFHVGNSEVWLEEKTYNYDQDPWTLGDHNQELAVCATDLSDTGDLTTASVMFMKPEDPVKYVCMQFFIPEAQLKNQTNGELYQEWSKQINPQTGEPYLIVCKGNRINQKEVADWYQRLRDRYQIEPYSIGYDKWHSDLFLHWCDKKTGYGFRTEMILQGKYLSFPMKSVERDLTDRLINYGNNPILKYCFSKTSIKTTGDLIQPVKLDGLYSNKIDGVVTLIMLYATLDKSEFYLGG